MQQVSAEKLELIRERRTQGASWLALVKETGISMFVLKCALQEGFRDHLRQKVRNSRARRSGTYRRAPSVLKKADTVRLSDPDGKNKFGHASIGSRVESSPFVPRVVQEDQQRVLAYKHSDLTSALQGDPPPWRSALGRKNGWR